MNRKLISLALLALASFSSQAGVKVTALDLKTSGANGFVNITIDGHSTDIPDFKVNGKTIEITLGDAKAFSAISKNVKGAILTANMLNGKAVIKAVLPYDIAAEKVNLGWKNNNIEVIFPRGVVAKVEASRPVALNTVIPKKEENKVLAKVESKVAKESLNENYLNDLVNEDRAKTGTGNPIKNDEVKVQQAAIAKTEVTPAVNKSNDNFSFAGYAAKFTIFLAMVLGLFYGVVQVIKKGVFNRGKLGFLNNSQMIQVLSTTYVAPKRSLMVVKAHNQIFLVANSESGLTFLSEMTDTSGLIKEGEKQVTGTNFDLSLGTAETTTSDSAFKLKENINESSPLPTEKGITSLTAKDIVKFSDELKKKAKKLKPIEFN
jgi:flagellar biogenesis protein FliO